MTGTRTVRRLVIIVSEDAVLGHKPAYTEVVRRAHDAGLAGASVFRGIEGFGSSGLVHTQRLLSLAATLPAMVVIVDSPDKIEEFLRELAPLEIPGVITVEDVQQVLPGDPAAGGPG